MTAQVPNRILLHGKHQDLLSWPEVEFLERLEVRPRFTAESTANWKGYVSQWEVREKRLFLLDITGTICTRPVEDGAPPAWCRKRHFDYCEQKPITLRDFSDVPSGGLPATWYSGELRVPQGQLREYVEGEWAPGQQRELLLLLSVEHGQVIIEAVALSMGDPARVRSFDPAAPLWQRLLAAWKTHY